MNLINLLQALDDNDANKIFVTEDDYNVAVLARDCLQGYLNSISDDRETTQLHQIGFDLGLLQMLRCAVPAFPMSNHYLISFLFRFVFRKLEVRDKEVFSLTDVNLALNSDEEIRAVIDNNIKIDHFHLKGMKHKC